MRFTNKLIALTLIIAVGSSLVMTAQSQTDTTNDTSLLKAIHDEEAGTITILRENSDAIILVQNAQEEIRPSRQIMGDWHLSKGESEIVRYRIMVYTGELESLEMTRLWTEYATESEDFIIQ